MRKLKMLILKILFSPLWMLIILFILLLYLVLKIRGKNDFTLKEMGLFDYWRI